MKNILIDPIKLSKDIEIVKEMVKRTTWNRLIILCDAHCAVTVGSYWRNDKGALVDMNLTTKTLRKVLARTMFKASSIK